ncbi:MAG: Fe-S cluster assembly protein HesB [Nanoarchaeota archaeon]
MDTSQAKILRWYSLHKRDLPWRKTKDPYAILVSEIMLQQTQVDRVIPYHHRFLKRFPDFGTLSLAKPATVLTYWSGLGYNRRAIMLHRLAKAVVNEHHGELPKTFDQLVSLPGIGPYTACAVLAFAHNQPVPVIDTNIRRVLIHELELDPDISMKELEKIAIKAIPKGKSRVWHNALMDYGAMVMTAKKTGIRPVSAQPSFKGSDREVRGYIIRELVKGKTVSSHWVQKAFPDKDVLPIIVKMEKEGIIKGLRRLSLE